MNISIIGTGYVGVVTGACLADRGHMVTLVGADAAWVEALNAGRSPVVERGLDELLQRNAGRRLRASSDLAKSVHQTEVTFIASPAHFNGRSVDIDAVLGAARAIGTALKDKSEYHLVVVQSTVVPGTTDLQVRPELEAASGKECGLEFGLGMNPEFLTEGDAVRDFLFPDRIILGGIDWRSIAHIAEVYRPFVGAPQIQTNTRTAELIKYSSNALLATLISFSNEIANLGTALGEIDPVVVMRGLQMSQYFRGRNADSLPPITAYLQPGSGLGGNSIPQDVKALVAHGRAVGEPMSLLGAVIATNERQPDRITQLLERRWPELQGIRITILGLAFRPQSHDVRESPAIPVIRTLLDRGAIVTAFDPVAMPNFRRHLPEGRIRYADSLSAALVDSDAAVIVTPWPEFSGLTELLKGRQPQPLVVDNRRAYSSKLSADYAVI